jgi:hypothetical protein
VRTERPRRRAPTKNAAILAAFAVVGALAACSEKKPDAAASSGALAAPGPGDGPVADRVVASLYDLAPMCDVEHRGILVDLGTPSALGRVSVRGDSGPMETAEHDGATWAVAQARGFDVKFVLVEPTPIFAAIHLAPVGAKSVSLFVDDLPLGSGRLRGGATTIETSPTTQALDAGEHVLGVRFSPGRVKESYADVDWVRVGFPDELTVTYGPPTADDVVQPSAVLNKVPHRAFSLRTPAVVRCPLRVPAGARLRVAVGMVGAGESDAEIAVRSDSEPPVSLLRRTIRGGDEAAWDDFEAPLDQFAGRIVELELRAASGATSGRILFGDPEVLVPTIPPPKTPEAQVVVLVVLSGVDREDLPGYSTAGGPGLERLSKLAEHATRFGAHRGVTNVVPAALATLLTALPPEASSVTDYGAKLPDSSNTVLTSARGASRQVGFFSGVPHSFGPSGLARGATQVSFSSPVSGEAEDPLPLAARWITTTLAADPKAKLLVVVHARGGHPPWAVSQKQLDTLPPENYTGDLSPRRAAQQLAMLRRKKARLDLSEQDLIRIAALYKVSLVDQDQKLGGLLDALTDAGVDESSVVMVTGDVSGGLDSLFADTPPLDEHTLALPLFVQFPTGMFAGRAVEEATTPLDLAVTLAASLGLPAPREGFGRDLAGVASGVALPDDGPSVATAAGLAAARWGSFTLRQRDRGAATLCEVDLDPTCTFDRRPMRPLLANALERLLARHDEHVAKSAQRGQSVVIDDETLAALRVWGSME